MCLTVNNPSDPCCESVPPEPLMGEIFRWMRPESVADYAGLSTAQWQLGVTGHTLPPLNDHCLYHLATSPNRRTTAVWDILNPIRWTIAGPDSDGQMFDHWFPESFADPTYPGMRMVGRIGSSSRAVGNIGLREKFMPRNWHCRFRGDIVSLSRNFLGGLQSLTSQTGEFVNETFLGSLAPDVGFWEYSPNSFSVMYDVHAIAYRINGQPAGNVQLATSPGALRVRVKPSDTLSIDVWYRVGHQASPTALPTPGKVIGYIPLENVTTGSTRNMHQLFSFANVDFSPRFNPHKQTYEVTIAGHRGWQLRNGSNGPHKMLSGPGGSWFGSGRDGGYCAGISIDPISELPQMWFFPGNAMKARHEGISDAVLYRSRLDADKYRRSSVSIEYGAIEHASPGRFVQEGTTVFHLVPWTVKRGNIVYGDDYPFGVHLAEGRKSGGSVPVYNSLPRTITVSRVAL